MNRGDYFIELFCSLPRGGPGDNDSTRTAFRMMYGLPNAPRILDIGCGPGMQTVELLRLCAGSVVAIDLLPRMNARVRMAADRAGVGERLETMQVDMRELDFPTDSFDVVWSEGAIYNLGFERGLAKVQPWVKPGGYVAVSEAVWLTPHPPLVVLEFWKEYPEIDSVDAKLAVISQLGYKIVGHFVLPATSWTTLYYDPLAERIAECEKTWRGIQEAEDVLAEARHEIAVFRKHPDCYSYAFFVMKKE